MVANYAVAKIGRGTKDCALIIGVGRISGSLLGFDIVGFVAVVERGASDMAPGAGVRGTDGEAATLMLHEHVRATMSKNTYRSVFLSMSGPPERADVVALEDEAAADATLFLTLATAPEAFALMFFAASLAPANEGRAGRNGIVAEFWLEAEAALQLWSEGKR